MSEPAKDDTAAAPKKGKKKLLIGAVALLAMVGGGVGAGVYAANAGLIGGGKGHAETPEMPEKPHLVPKSEQKAASEGEGEEKEGGGEAKEGEEAESSGGKPTPEGQGGDQYASNYYALDKDFTSNLRDSVHVVQVGVAISTPYDDKVIENLKTNDIAVRSAVLLALGDTPEEQVFSSDGKRQLQARLVKAINATLQQKEGFGGVGNVYFTSFVVQ